MAFQLFNGDVTVDNTITAPLQFQFTEASFVAGGVMFNATGGIISMTVQLQRP